MELIIGTALCTVMISPVLDEGEIGIRLGNAHRAMISLLWSKSVLTSIGGMLVT